MKLKLLVFRIDGAKLRFFARMDVAARCTE